MINNTMYEEVPCSMDGGVVDPELLDLQQRRLEEDLQAGVAKVVIVPSKVVVECLFGKRRHCR